MEEVFSGISADLARVQELLKTVLSKDDLPLDEGLRRLLSGPGKLLRPGLMLLIANQEETADSRRAATFGCALEMLHLATLLHDDVIDGSSTRRRLPTTAQIIGDKGSILLGDYLFARSLRMLVENSEFEALRLLARTVEVCAEGELMEQMNLFNLWLSEEQYVSIIDKKTAGLFAAACKLGCALNGQNEVASAALARFGRSFGQGFQVIDDLLDFLGDSGALGKPSRQDLAQGVITLPTILAVRDSEGRAVREPPLRAFGPGDEERIRQLVLQGDALETTLDRAGALFREAERSINEGCDLDGHLVERLTALSAALFKRGENALRSFREGNLGG